MTTLVLSEVFPPKVGGSGRWLWELYRRLPRESVLVAAGSDPRQEEFDRSHDVRLVRLGLSLPSWGIMDAESRRAQRRLVGRLKGVIAEEKVGAVHCGRCLPEGHLALWLKLLTGVPYLCYVHGEELNLASQSRELTWLTRLVLRGASALIANSRNTESILRDDWNVSGRRVRVMHPGIDVQVFQPDTRRADVRAELGWGGRPVLLTVGRLQVRKGHDRMIRAIADVRRTCPDLLYAIAGDGEEGPALRDLVASEGVTDHVQFLGEVDDQTLVRCYQQCDLFVLPNRRVGRDIEGFGIVLLEAQACGKPVIAGDSGGTAETMRIPETGLVVSCDEPGPLARVVSELLADGPRREQMGRAARRWIVEHFDWSVLARQAWTHLALRPIAPARRLAVPS